MQTYLLITEKYYFYFISPKFKSFFSLIQIYSATQCGNYDTMHTILEVNLYHVTYIKGNIDLIQTKNIYAIEM